MFFIISKIALFFLQPFNWILFLLAIWYFSKNEKVKKRLLILTAFLAIVLSNGFLRNEAELSWQVNKSGVVPGKQYEAGILLGGLSGYDKNQVGHFSGACDRFIETVILYKQGIIKKIVVSSGSAYLFIKAPGEADFLYEKLLASGIPAKDILIENKSRNTFENASFSKHILDSLHLQGPYVLISSAFHLHRALQVFDKAGIKVVPYPCAFNATEKIYSWDDYVWPSLDVLMSWGGLIKEYVGVVMYKITGKA